MSLEDLDFKIRIDSSDAPKAMQALGEVKTVVSDISTAAVSTQFNLSAMSSTMKGMAVAAAPLKLIGGHMGVLSTTSGLAASGLATLASGFGVLHHLAVYLSAGIGMVLAPLRGLVILPRLIMGSFGLMFSAILMPLKIFAGLLTMVYRGVMVLLGPVIALARAWFSFKMALGAISLQFSILWKVMAILPPQIRILVGALVALGAAGRAGSLAMGILTAGIRAVGFAALAVTKPFRAMTVAAMFTGRMLVSLAVSATTAAVSLAKLAAASVVAGLRAIGSAVVSLAGMIKGVLLGAVAMVSKAFALFGAVAIYWGAKVAIGLETAETIFGVLLKDMEQGKALMASLNATKVAPFFDSKQIQDAGRDLIKAGVPVTQVTTKLEQLGQMAVATKTPLEDLSRIYRQGMARGAFQTDLVNQMAERGIDIYHALTAVTGLHGAALSKAMQDGQIGAVQMNAAIQHMTTGNGIYAGSVEAVGKTTAGMWAQVKNNFGQALAAMMTGGVAGMKSLLESAVVVTEGMKTSFAALSPVVMQTFGVIGDAFRLVSEIATAVWTGIHGEGTATFGNLISVGMQWATKFRWFFQNFADIARFAFAQFSLFGVTAFNDFIYFFTDKIPAYLNWFSENWKQVFIDAGNLIVTVFSNIATNIGNAMRAIWSYIKSGGTTELKFAFVPLLDGFKATVAELPDIPARAMTDLEKNLSAQVETLGTGLANSFDAMQASATASLNAIQPAMVELQDTTTGGDGVIADGTAAAEASKKAVENKAALVRSSEGQSVVAQFLKGMKSDDTTKRQAKAAEKAAGHLEHIAREIDRGRPLQSRAFA